MKLISDYQKHLSPEVSNSSWDTIEEQGKKPKGQVRWFKEIILVLICRFINSLKKSRCENVLLNCFMLDIIVTRMRITCEKCFHGGPTFKQKIFGSPHNLPYCLGGEVYWYHFRLIPVCHKDSPINIVMRVWDYSIAIKLEQFKFKVEGLCVLVLSKYTDLLC